MSSIIYLDNNATTRIAPEVFDVMASWLRDGYGNPSSGYALGRDALGAVETAREQVAALAGCREDEILFTSCGTESINTAVQAAIALDPDKRHIVTSTVEHSATIKLCEHLAQRGYEITWLPVDHLGRLDPAQVAEAVNEETALVNGACHVLAVGDIMEPVEAWLKWKFEKSGGRHWDYVFRRLFYVWTPAIATTQFSKPLELDNVDQTAGHIMNLDLWIDRDGAAHVLYQKISVHNPALRDKFLPGVPIRTSLEYCVVRDNKIVSRQTLAIGGEGVGGEITGWARFHVTGDGRLFVFYYCSGKDSKGKALDENRLMEILPGGRHTDPVKVGLKHPFVSFMTATVRGGSQPSNILDVLGICQGKSVPTICYARIRL